ncbi:Nuclear Hormone Receptor family [Aphelenchoides fujianensis]|nr:Nuclear Hormone Receptor family [Aphelenchoides fujianensis]KAI6221899.1 Nuclear Hormone Receptor family [Aphelenchoides fujianensis]
MPEEVLCGVCGQDGAARHYGGISCLSCRSHFRRVVRQNRRPLCAKDGRCEVGGSGRKSCRACRYSRCLAIGMDPKLVRSDRTLDEDARQQWKAIEEKEERSSQSVEVVHSSSRRFEVLLDFEGPLGFRAGVVLPVRGDFSAFLHYALESDRFVDEFSDTGFGHNASSPNFRYDMNLSIEEAIFLVPRRLANRTKMIWKPNSWVTAEEFPRVLCRGMLFHIDVISTIPELRLLEPRDQTRLAVGRGMQTGELVVIQRTLKSTEKKCVLLAGGSYVPLEEDELSAYKPKG